jgi:hypothetical protein
VKTFNQAALEFVENPDQEFSCELNGKPCDTLAAEHVLRDGKMFENGIEEDNGDALWFSGTLNGEAFSFFLRGKGIAAKIRERVFVQ